MDKLSELTHGAKIVLGAAIAFLIVSIFNWQEVSASVGGVEIASAGRSMWAGVGIIAGLLAIVLIVWQVLRLANINLEVGVTPSMITAALAVLLVIFTLLKIIIDNEALTFWAWLGLILSVVVAVGAWLNMQAAGESLADMRDRVSSMTSTGGGSSAPAATAPPPPAPEAPPAPPAPSAPSDTDADDTSRPVA